MRVSDERAAEATNRLRSGWPGSMRFDELIRDLLADREEWKGCLQALDEARAENTIQRHENERLRRVVEVAKELDNVYENEVGFTDPPDGSVGSCLDAKDSIALDKAHDKLRQALNALKDTP